MVLCRVPNCGKHATFGTRFNYPLYCKLHKQESMQDVKHVLCCVPDCKKRATFGLTEVSCCFSHQKEGMRDLRHPSCVKCYRRPSYCLTGRTPTHCHVHKTLGMKNVKHPHCQHCDTLATYGYQKNKPLRCLQHKEEHMTNVKATSCEAECKKRNPQYGNHNTGRVFCKDHHDPREHWRLSTCQKEKCKDIATHSLQGQLPFLFCEAHSPEGYQSCLEQVCKSCNLSFLCDGNGYCLLSCSQQVSHRGKYTEHALHQFFLQKGLSFVYDHQPSTGCTKMRPDFVFQTLYGILIVENDEHKHAQYNAECELARMQELWLSFGEAVHFIRFNPDPTCTHKDLLTDRHNVLFEKVREVLDDSFTFFQNHPGLTFQYLYYE